ncbi:MAG: tRNA (guanosine(37)-N1)-methyltransferase TrmD [Actinomycetota bacterium]
MTMLIDVVTIFPEFFAGPLEASLLGKARQRGLVDVRVHDLRDHATDPHRTVDDDPYGGGVGMVMKPEVWFGAVEAIDGWESARRVLLTPAGRRLDQDLVRELAPSPHLILLCGRYEGIDERVAEGMATDELSVGDYVLAGGESAAMVVIEAVTRLVPGVVKEAESVRRESFGPDGLLDYPQYTRPAEFRSMRVPDVLLSGDHGEIEAWRRKQALERTKRRRPDLLGPDLDIAP